VEIVSLTLMRFLPEGFDVPEVAVTDRFKVQVLSIHVVVKDYDAVMTSRKELWARFGELWGWPPEDLSLEQDMIDLAWHQKEFQLRNAFAYSVMSLDDRRLLGCVYIDPTEVGGYDGEVFFWVRTSELETGLEDELEHFVRNWIVEAWPFKSVLYPGREPG
jgi:hypothetical protein